MQTLTTLNTLKGRIAEQLIQDLFIKCDYNVFNYGLERIHPSLSKSIRRGGTNNKTTSKALRFMPDFVVQSITNGDLFYLEVKFRANGEFYFDEKYTDYPYKNAWFVIVSPEKIQCMHYKRLKAGYKILPDTNYPLTAIRSFHIKRDLLEEYTAYTQAIFQAYQKK